VPLTINLGRVRSGKGTTSNFELSVTQFDFLNNTIELNKPLKVSVMVTNTGRTLELKGYVQTEIKTKCNRCLEEVVLPLNTVLEEELVYFADLRYLGELSQEEIEEKYFIYDNDIFDLSHIIRENINLSLPIKILCDEKCRGLCSKCGQNLNLNQCNCTTEEIDPRLAILAKLKGSEEV